MKLPFLEMRILDWLGVWRYSSAPIIKLMLWGNSSSKRHYSYLSSLESKRLIKKRNYQQYTVYELSKEGYNYISLLNDLYEYPRFQWRLTRNSSTMYHDMYCQYVAAITYPINAERSKISERYFTSLMMTNSSLILPDFYLIIDSPPRRVYYEIELSDKNTKRIYYKYANQVLTAADNDTFSFVYVFNNTTTMARYQRAFNEPVFPLYRRVGTGLKQADVFTPPHGVRQRFTFCMVTTLDRFSSTHLTFL